MVLGTITLIPVQNKFDTYTIVSGSYNFDPKWTEGINFRNIGNTIGYIVNNNYLISPTAAIIPQIYGGSFPITILGEITIKP